MSFLAKLMVDGQVFNILQCNYRFKQNIDAIGQPVSITMGGQMHLTIESMRGNTFYDWMISPTMMKSGSIVFYRRDTMSKLKELVFNDAYCIEYNERYNHEGEYPMQIDIELSAKEFILDESAFKNNWVEEQ